MKSGTVQNLVAGGLGYSADISSTVTTANIIINGGTISNAVAGGGYFNAKVSKSNIQMNGGTALTVQGGGMASGKIDGVNYSVGTKEDSENSPNRTENAKVTISGGNNTLLFSGSIESLDPGTSNGSPITIDNKTYNVAATDSFKITNDNIGDSKKTISYDFTDIQSVIILFVVFVAIILAVLFAFLYLEIL